MAQIYFANLNDSFINGMTYLRNLPGKPNIIITIIFTISIIIIIIIIIITSVTKRVKIHSILKRVLLLLLSLLLFYYYYHYYFYYYYYYYYYHHHHHHHYYHYYYYQHYSVKKSSIPEYLEERDKILHVGKIDVEHKGKDFAFICFISGTESQVMTGLDHQLRARRALVNDSKMLHWEPEGR